MPGVLPNEHRTKRRKLLGNDLYRDVLGSPKLVVAPMVDQSELPWRILSRRYGAQLVYTPMINAKMFISEKHKGYREQAFSLIHGEEGGALDRPLIVQFAANDPDHLLNAARLVESHCDAVDINLGCPQDIARRGRYGCYLQDDWDLIYRLINNLHENLSIPVTAKFRVFPSVEKTVEYAKMLERAGAQILTCHGRTRDQRGQNTGLADWSKIRAVKEVVSVPVFANGNILFHGDIQHCLDMTGADAVMTAEANLYNPTVLLPCSALKSSSRLSDPLSVTNPHPLSDFFVLPDDSGAYLPATVLAFEYLSIVRSLRTPTHNGAIKGHLFKLLRPALGVHTDLRARLGTISAQRDVSVMLDEYESLVQKLEARLVPEIEKVRNGEVRLSELVTVGEATGLRTLPHWLAQPYFRSLRPSKPTAVIQKAKSGDKSDSFDSGIANQEKPVKKDESEEVEKASENTRTEIVLAETGIAL